MKIIQDTSAGLTQHLLVDLLVIFRLHVSIAGFAGDHLTRVLVGMAVEPDIPLRKFSKDSEMMRSP